MINNSDEFDKPICECGVIGVYNHPKASLMAYYMLHALQHRGQEAAGITTIYYDEKRQKNRYCTHKDLGLVLDVFKDHETLEELKGSCAIGHNRYSTTGASDKMNIQPFNMIYQNGILSLAHNGNLTNTSTLRDELRAEGAIFQTTTDSEIFMHLIARSKKNSEIERIHEALRTTRGSYSIVVLTEHGLIAARDPHGVRPLSIGMRKNADGTNAYFVASETRSFDMIGAEYLRSVHHNEMIIIDDETVKTGEIKSMKIADETPTAAQCIFEYVYFSCPDSKIFGHNVDKVRRKMGKLLGEEAPVVLPDKEKVCVISVPDSANTHALGFTRTNNDVNPTVFEIGLIRSHYVGRTFIAPGQDNREFKVKVKFNTVKGVIENRNIVLIDDSIVRGTTSKLLIKLLREAGPKRLFCRISSPRIKYPCYYGMDFPSRSELIANHYESEKEIGDAIGVDDLHYLSPAQLLAAVPHDEGIGYCTACFTGEYPIEVEEKMLKKQHK